MEEQECRVSRNDEQVQYAQQQSYLENVIKVGVHQDGAGQKWFKLIGPP